MRLLGNITPATRISFALMTATVTVVLTASAAKLLPDPLPGMADARLRLSEALAMQISATARNADPAALPALIDAMLEQYPDLVSVGLHSDDELIFASPEHDPTWEDEGLASVTLPIIDENQLSASVELHFMPLPQNVGRDLTIRLAIFVGLLGFVLYRLYLHHILKYLDPSSVIPDRVKAMLDTMAEGVLVLDHRERVLLANEAFAQSTGFALTEVQGRTVAEIPWNGDEGEHDLPSLTWAEAASKGTAVKGVEFTLHRADGVRVFAVNATPILGGDGSCRGAMATFDDMTAIEEKNAKLEQMVRELDAVRQHVEEQNEDLKLLATRDALTGCWNRRALFEQLEKEWSAAHRYDHALTCIMLDIDHFKSVNDNHGHAMGDEVLQRVADALKSNTRDADIVGRYGGEEFCIVMPHVELEQAALAAEKLRCAIESLVFPELRITSSFGIASLAVGPADPPDLVDLADRALYAAKKTGRNRVVCSDQMPELPPEEQEPTADTPTGEERVHIPFTAVLGLVAALEQRHADTADHSRRVADLCMMVADGLMSAGDAVVLEVAAMLHDIGKIGVPDAVLLKPGPLTEEEWEVMERHDHIGTEIINSAFKSVELTNIVVNHHARYGGGGDDPSLPTGTEIPLRARIITIADAYDAMVSDRVYRKGMSQEAAIAELRRCAGSQFDPELVERFIDRLLARESDRPSDVPDDDAVESALRLGLMTERLAASIEGRDLRTLALIAERIGQAASARSWTEIGELATEVSEAASAADDLEQVLESTRDLLYLCHQTQSQVLRATRSKFDRSAA